MRVIGVLFKPAAGRLGGIGLAAGLLLVVVSAVACGGGRAGDGSASTATLAAPSAAPTPLAGNAPLATPTPIAAPATSVPASTPGDAAAPTPGGRIPTAAAVTLPDTPVPAPALTPGGLRPASTAPAVALPPDTPVPVPPPPLPALRLERVSEAAVDFVEPTNLMQPAAGGPLYVTERRGLLLEWTPEASPGGGLRTLLDFRGQVNSGSQEEGLLGLAFDPQFQRNGYFYLHYSAAGPRRSVVSRFMRRDGRAAWDSEVILLEIAQPYPNHNGGQLAFGPDGYLYIALGDGGAAGDPHHHGQNPATLLGAILRLDVSQTTPETPYRIPADNPWAGLDGARGEIWAYGLRNPWRFSFDRQTGQLWAGDVGQNAREEVDLITRGGNYGWAALEGNHCFRPAAGCVAEGRIPPVAEYPLGGGVCSVIGGYVYRGAEIPALDGVYVYGDYCSGEIYGLRYDYAGQRITAGPQTLAETGGRIMSFAEDYAGRLYVLLAGGGIYRLAEG